MATQTQDVLPNVLRKKQVTQRTGLSSSYIYLLISQGKFPSPIKLGERASGWIESEVNKWIKDRINQSRNRAEIAA